VLISSRVGLRGESGQRFAAEPTPVENCPLALFTIARPQERQLPVRGRFDLLRPEYLSAVNPWCNQVSSLMQVAPG